ncbi:MAG TPA: sigma-70 family RNA polymerase sigma factor [Planctomycetota bacterium]|nr:sigma-70 family RNA polymerase sigma factor [Planctomycetota bacterium]
MTDDARREPTSEELALWCARCLTAKRAAEEKRKAAETRKDAAAAERFAADARRHAAEAERPFNALYDKWFGPTRGFVWGEIKDARPFIKQGFDEICCDVWFRISKSIHGFRAESKFFTWVCAIATLSIQEHIQTNHWSQTKQAPFDAEGGQPILDEIQDHREPPAATQAMNSEVASDLDAAIRTLDEKQRTAFVLRFKKRLTWREITEITGEHKTSLQRWVTEATERLRPFLRKHDPESRQE